MTVWDRLIGQHAVIETLQRAVGSDPGSGMSHAWLFTGPPGSGRSNAAVAFAAALHCDSGGCGACKSCHEVAAGTHPDVQVTRTEKLSIGVGLSITVRGAPRTPVTTTSSSWSSAAGAANAGSAARSAAAAPPVANATRRRPTLDGAAPA